jgi:TP901 family phage tail tape measure protein
MPTKTVVEQLIIEIAGDPKKYKAAIKEVQKQNRGFETTMKKAAKVGAASFAAIGAAAVTLGTVATKAFAEFETGVTNVAKTTNLAGRELDDFKDEIIKMSERIPVTTDKLLEIATAAGQLGIKGTANLSKFTETIAKLGATTNVEGEEAALAIARILNLTNESIDSVDKFGSALVDLGNNFATSEAEILEVSKDVAKATVQFGLASDEILGISAAMSSLGIAAEAGGTVVGKAFASIDAAIREQTGPAFEKLMELTGMTGDQLTETFATDAPKVFQKFIEGLGRAGAQGKDMTAELGQMNLSGIRVNKILPTLASRSDLLAEALERAGIASRDAAALNAEAATAFATNASKWQIAQNKINNSFIKLGEEVAPEVTQALEDISTEVSKSGDAIIFLGKFIARTAEIVNDFIADIKKLNGMIQKGIKPIVDTVKARKDYNKQMAATVKMEDMWLKKQKESQDNSKKYADDWAKNAASRSATDEQYVDGWLIKEDERVQKAQESGDKIVQSTQDAADKRNAAIEAEALERAEIQADADADEFERIEDFSDEVVKEIEKREKEKLAAEEAKLSDGEKLYKKYHGIYLEDEKTFGKSYAAIKDLQRSTEYGATKTAAGELSSLINSENDNLKAIGKAAAIVQIGITTTESALKAYSGLAWIPVVGPALGGVAAAALVAYGGEQISKVQGMQTGGIVPGTGSGDIVPAMLEPGELVVPKNVVPAIMKMLGARGMQDGGVAAEQKTKQTESFYDLFRVPQIFWKLIEGQEANVGGGSEFSSGMEKILAEAADEIYNNIMPAGTGKVLAAAAKVIGRPVSDIRTLLEDNAVTNKLEDLFGEDFVNDLLYGGLGGFSGILKGAAEGYEKIKEFFGFNKGGFVPGSGGKDSVAAMLTPGELVIPKDFASSIGSISGGGVGRSSISSGSGGAGMGPGMGGGIIGIEISMNDNAAEVINAQIREGSELGTIKPAT